MMMEILAVGSADMNSECFSASCLINGKILVDIPGGACRELLKRGISPESVKAVMITHLHGDHILDLPVWALKKTKTVPAPEDGSIRICAGKDQKDCLETIVRSSFSTSLTEEKTGRYFRWITENEFTVEGLHVRRIPVRHGILPACFGYQVTDGSVTAGFTGDSCLCDGVREIVASSDTVFCDCDLINGNDKHMGIDDLVSLKKEFPHARIIATHLNDNTRKELLRLRPEGITAASDGTVFRI